MILPYKWIITALRGNPKAGSRQPGDQASGSAHARPASEPTSGLAFWRVRLAPWAVRLAFQPLRPTPWGVRRAPWAVLGAEPDTAQSPRFCDWKGGRDRRDDAIGDRQSRAPGPPVRDGYRVPPSGGEPSWRGRWRVPNWNSSRLYWRRVWHRCVLRSTGYWGVCRVPRPGARATPCRLPWAGAGRIRRTFRPRFRAIRCAGHPS